MALFMSHGKYGKKSSRNSSGSIFRLYLFRASFSIRCAEQANLRFSIVAVQGFVTLANACVWDPPPRCWIRVHSEQFIQPEAIWNQFVSV